MQTVLPSRPPLAPDLADPETIEILPGEDPLRERRVMAGDRLLATLRRDTPTDDFKVFDAGGVQVTGIYSDPTVPAMRAAPRRYAEMDDDTAWFWAGATLPEHEGGFLPSPARAEALLAEYAVLRATPSVAALAALEQGWSRALAELWKVTAPAATGLHEACRPVAPDLPEDQALLADLLAIRQRMADRLAALRAALPQT